jgi:hypothetical protein
MPLSDERLYKYCCPNGGARQCIYLYEEQNNDSMVFQCAKLIPDKRAYIDELVQDVINRCYKDGVDPWTLGSPIGSNCPGVLRVKYMKI